MINISSRSYTHNKKYCAKYFYIFTIIIPHLIILGLALHGAKPKTVKVFYRVVGLTCLFYEEKCIRYARILIGNVCD